jgi:hypothetical protein
MKNYEDILDLIEKTDRLIRLKATGTASQLADTLGYREHRFLDCCNI